MEDYSFGGTEEENAELKKLKTEVVRGFITQLTYHRKYRSVSKISIA